MHSFPLFGIVIFVRVFCSKRCPICICKIVILNLYVWLAHLSSMILTNSLPQLSVIRRRHFRPFSPPIDNRVVVTAATKDAQSPMTLLMLMTSSNHHWKSVVLWRSSITLMRTVEISLIVQVGKMLNLLIYILSGALRLHSKLNGDNQIGDNQQGNDARPFF